MPIVTPNLAHTAGVPSQWNDTIDAALEGLIVGETPAVVTVDMIALNGAALPAYSPVKLDGADKLVAATIDAPAIGITLYPIDGLTANIGIPVLRSGCLAKHRITWPAAYNTDALKLNAFNDAPTPTNIVVREVYFGATVAAP
ncbi:MAG: hypothetical protein EOS07_21805 [Mesorhizobium sp.]|uniref:hypothetical protein n=1 Tax=Mesorhizobium sp. TaxID=1871066 RepID=UPI000FE8A9CF|nr:hypothetical protein [Mesorhizobium sp.]RWO06278.1 MAG: hypothetical protein EOS07_21805 [Mesorhizobium sp.]RWP29853.1 MAG: hypothetical protein EOR03_25680 [Mesorhizobium sp.]